jgi:hypothetical protein
MAHEHLEFKLTNVPGDSVGTLRPLTSPATCTKGCTKNATLVLNIESETQGAVYDGALCDGHVLAAYKAFKATGLEFTGPEIVMTKVVSL